MSNVTSTPNIGHQAGSTALEASRQLTTGPGALVSLVGYNSGPDQFIQVHDVAAAPADGAVPIFMFRVGAGQHFALDTPIKCVVGIFACNSSTVATKTAGAADCWFLGRYL